jgi:hypothetical protein
MCLVLNSNCNVDNLETSNFHLIGENIDGSKHSFLDGSVPMLVVGSEKPFLVHEVNDAFVTKFGFEKSLVCGRSIGFLQGPKTNSLHLMGALGAQSKDCLQSTCEEAPLSAPGKSVVLYSKTGVESSLHIHSKPLKSIEGVAKRLVLLADSEAITLQVAQQESLVSKVIIEASARQAIQFTNTQFLDMYGLKENQVLTPPPSLSAPPLCGHYALRRVSFVTKAQRRGCVRAAGHGALAPRRAWAPHRPCRMDRNAGWRGRRRRLARAAVDLHQHMRGD